MPKLTMNGVIPPFPHMPFFHAQIYLYMQLYSVLWVKRNVHFPHRIHKYCTVNSRHVLWRVNSGCWSVTSKVLRNIRAWNMIRKARNKCSCHKSKDYGTATMQAGGRWSFWELLWERLDRSSMETSVVKEDCSGVKIVFLSSIVRSEGWHQVVTAELPPCLL